MWFFFSCFGLFVVGKICTWCLRPNVRIRVRDPEICWSTKPGRGAMWVLCWVFYYLFKVYCFGIVMKFVTAAFCCVSYFVVNHRSFLKLWFFFFYCDCLVFSFGGNRFSVEGEVLAWKMNLNRGGCWKPCALVLES